MSISIDKFAALSEGQMARSEGSSLRNAQVTKEDVQAFQQQMQGGPKFDSLSSGSEASKNKFDSLSSSSEVSKNKFDLLSSGSEGSRYKFDPLSSGSEGSKNKFDSLTSGPELSKHNLQGKVPQGNEMSKPTFPSSPNPLDNTGRVPQFETAPLQKDVPTKSQHSGLHDPDFESQMKAPNDSQSQSKPSEPSIDSLFKDFAAMTAQMNNLTTPGQTAPTEQATATAGLDSVNLNDLVSRILVNTPERGTSEVRLTLQDNVLRGTEISIMRDNDGLLTVRIMTDNATSFQSLVASRNDLQTLLQQQEGRVVNVQMLDESEEEHNDSRRRSKGLYHDEEADV